MEEEEKLEIRNGEPNKENELRKNWSQKEELKGELKKRRRKKKPKRVLLYLRKRWESNIGGRMER